MLRYDESDVLAEAHQGLPRVACTRGAISTLPRSDRVLGTEIALGRKNCISCWFVVVSSLSARETWFECLFLISCCRSNGSLLSNVRAAMPVLGPTAVALGPGQSARTRPLRRTVSARSSALESGLWSGPVCPLARHAHRT